MRLSDLAAYESITIQCHDNPDADALASGYGLFCFFQSRGINARIVYSGKNKIQKSNLCLMLEKLALPVEYIPVADGETVRVDGLLITVDCQYGSGNVTGLEADTVAVVDHHQLDHEVSELSVVNSALGSCSTLVWKLLKEEGFDVDANENLCTALYYGLYTDTNQFTEISNPLDMDMREDVDADLTLISLFRNSNLTLRELEIAGIALIRHSYNDDYEFAVIKSQPCDPNLLGLISDFLLQVDAIKSCVVFNEANGGYKFSVRSCIKEVNASELAQFLAEGIGSGGGHYEKAGGFISLAKYEEKFPTLHTEGYFNNRMTQYFDSFDIIHAEEETIDTKGMQQFVKRKSPLGYVIPAEFLLVDSQVTVRTHAGDMEITVDEDTYLIVERKGNVLTISRDKFEQEYELPEDEYDAHDYLGNPDYVPVVKNRNRKKDILLTDYMRPCVPGREEVVYAKTLEKGVKVFTLQDKYKYQTGTIGDYLLVRCDNVHDIYVVEKDIFEKNYDEL